MPHYCDAGHDISMYRTSRYTYTRSGSQISQAARSGTRLQSLEQRIGPTAKGSLGTGCVETRTDALVVDACFTCTCAIIYGL